ncbi:MAG: Ig-like domain-containing protein, partial [SAR324 cluster bacterium]|nr:Ig-like domain-containing protein [SAR324 cluster bacterium]
MSRRFALFCVAVLFGLAACGDGVGKVGSQLSGTSEAAGLGGLASGLLGHLRTELSGLSFLRSSSRNHPRSTDRAKSSAPGTPTPASVRVANPASLTSDQIETLVSAASQALVNAGIGDSADLIQVLPQLLEGAGSGLGTLATLSASERLAVLKTLGSTGSNSLSGRRDYLDNASAVSGQTAMETLMGKVSQRLTGTLGNTGIGLNELDNASGTLLSGMASGFSAGGVSSEETGGALTQSVAGGTAGLGEIVLSGHDSTSVTNALGAITSEVTASLGTLPGHDSSLVSARLKLLAQGAAQGIGTLRTSPSRSASRIILSDNDTLTLTSTVAQKAVAALGRIDNVSSDNLSSFVSAVTEGVVENLGKTGTTGTDALSSLTNAVIESAVDGLDEITLTGYDADDLEDMVGGITSGATKGLGGLSSSGVNAAAMPMMLKAVTKAASKGLNRLDASMLDNASKLSGLLNRITSSTVDALQNVSLSGFDPSDATTLKNLVQEVISGATESLDNLTLARQDSAFDLQTSLTQIATGAVGGAKGITQDTATLNDLQDNATQTLQAKAGQLQQFDNSTVNVQNLDMTEPAIDNVTPVDNTTNFFIRGVDAWSEEPVTVSFNERMDRRSVNQTNLLVQSPQGRVPGTLSVTVNSDNKTIARFWPTAPLRYRTRYVIQIRKHLRDTSGNRLAKDEIRRFETEYPLNFSAKAHVPSILEHLTASRIHSSDNCTQRCYVAEARIVDTDPWGELQRTWRLDNQTLSEDFALMLSDTRRGDA